MLALGVIINAVGIVLGILVGLFSTREIPSKTQAWIQTFLAAFLLYIALRISYYELHPGIVSFLKGVFWAWLCLVVSAMAFRKSPLPRLINQLSQKAQHALQVPCDTPFNRKAAFLVGSAFFALTPLSFAGAALMGVYQDPRLFIVKGVIDFLGVLVFSRTLKASSFGIIIPMALLQLPLIYLFNAGLAVNVSTGMPIVGLITAYLCLHSALVLSGWNKSGTLFSYVPALFLAFLIEIIW